MNRCPPLFPPSATPVTSLVTVANSVVVVASVGGTVTDVSTAWLDSVTDELVDCTELFPDVSSPAPEPSPPSLPHAAAHSAAPTHRIASRLISAVLHRAARGQADWRGATIVTRSRGFTRRSRARASPSLSSSFDSTSASVSAVP